MVMHVSVHELKNSLSKYLRLVKQGETIVVTSHHTPLAKLSPIPEVEGPGLQRLLTLEGIQWDGKKPQGGRLRPAIQGMTAAERVLEDRR